MMTIYSSHRIKLDGPVNEELMESVLKHIEVSL